MSQSRITGAVLLCWEDCTSILSKHLTTLLQRPIQLCHMVEDYDYWCIALKTGRFSIPELHVLLDAVSAATADFPDPGGFRPDTLIQHGVFPCTFTAFFTRKLALRTSHRGVSDGN